MKELNQSELRIGNYVSLQKGVEESEQSLFKIKSIFFNESHNCYTVELNSGHLVNIDCLRPIILTESVLLRCGAKLDNYFRPYLERGAYQITFCEQASGTYHARIHREDMELKEGLAVGALTPYLHQIQNLFYSLTGFEIEPKLSNKLQSSTS